MNRHIVLFAAIALVISPAASIAQGVNPLDFTGDWQGRWENLTFGSKDSASLTVTADTLLGTLEAVLDLDGPVFGGSDPAPITLTGTYDAAGFSVSGSQAPYGDLTLAGDTNNVMGGRAVNLPNPGIDSVTLLGKYTEDIINLTYIVYFAFGGGTANGVLSMEKQTATGAADGPPIPARLALRQNYPNPFNPSTTIQFELPEGADLVLTVYNALGEEVARLAEGRRGAGIHSVVFDAPAIASGVYFVQLKAGKEVRIVKMARLQ